MEYADAKKLRETLYANMDAAIQTLQSFPKGALGLTPDSVKASAEWQRANAQFQHWFAQVRLFNADFNKAFKKQIQAERRARFAKIAD